MSQEKGTKKSVDKEARFACLTLMKVSYKNIGLIFKTSKLKWGFFLFFLSDLTFQFKEDMEQDKKFKCDTCGKTFKFKSILLLHSMKCSEISLENNDREISETETKINPQRLQQKQEKMKDNEYSVIINDDSSKNFENT